VGLIDTLSVGFDRITKRLWLILVPVLVDIGIWIGPKLSVAKLSQELLALLPSMAEFGAQQQQSLQLARDWLIAAGTEANLLYLLSMRILGLPSLTATFVPEARLLGIGERVIEIHTWMALVGLALVLTLLSLLLGCFSLAWLAQEARDEETDIPYVLQVTVRSWIRLTVLLLLGLLAGATLLIGVSLVYSILAVLSPQLATLLFSAMAIGLLWLSVYVGIVFFFTPRAMILDNEGIVRSLWSSINVIHRNIVPVVVFVLLVNVIQAGLMYIWRLLAVNTIGTLAGILGNAYVSTGLVMASLVFYRDRFVAWQDARAHTETDEG
jgi:hypothetical protein